MESKTSNDNLDTYICDDINGTFTACGGEFTFWKLKKFWYFNDNHFTVIIAIYPKCYETYGLCIFISTSSFVSNFVCFRETFAGFDIDESYNYIQRVI